MVTEAQARQILVNAFPGRSQAWYQAVQAIARGEGHYGNGWRNADITIDGVTYINRGERSNNWGAIQCGHATTPGGDCGPGCFPNLDKHANGKPYQGCFKKYPTPEAGAADFVYVLTDNGPERNRASVAAALDDEDASGYLDADAIAEAMHATGYMERAADAYAKNIAGNAVAIAQTLGEPQLVFRRDDLAPPSTSPSSILGGVCGLLLLIAGAYVGGVRL